MSSYDVIIIGSGIAALAAARTLTATTSRILILEGRNRIGGRIFTHSQGSDGPHVDLGGSMVHGYNEGNPAKKLLQQLGMDVHIPTGAKGLVYGDDGPLQEADSTSLFAQSTQMAYKPLPATPATESVASLLFPTLLKKDERLVALARTGEIGAGIELERTSAKWTGFERGFGGTDAFPDGGYGEMVKNMLADFKSEGGEIRLEEEVVSIEDSTTDRKVKVKTKNGTEVDAKAVISTIPLSILQKRPPTFSPPLPATLRGAIERTQVGCLEKVVLGYDSPWWPEPDTSGSFLLLPLSTASCTPSQTATAAVPSSLEDLFSRTTIPVTSFYRIASTPHPTLLVYIGSTAGRHLANYSTEEISSELHRYLVKRLSPSSSSSTVPSPTLQLVTDWSKDPFSLGATSTPITLSTSSDGEVSTPLDFILLGRPEYEGRLGFAGEHTDLDNHGSVAGALVSGFREGERVKVLLEGLKD